MLINLHICRFVCIRVFRDTFKLKNMASAVVRRTDGVGITWHRYDPIQCSRTDCRDQLFKLNMMTLTLCPVCSLYAGPTSASITSGAL